MTPPPLIIRLLVATSVLATPALAAHKRDGGGVPFLDVKGSCNDAQKFSSGGNDKNLAFKGCMQDEMSAKDTLVKRWGDFKAHDKQSCVEQSRAPSPSYVEVLTCLEMNTDKIRSSAPANQKIGGPAAPNVTLPGK